VGDEAAAEVDAAAMRADAMLALTTLGFTKLVAMRAVRDALAQDSPRGLDALLRAALRRCAS
jgi:Holliday junction resolvasome RuvABC DNA-binding subunit